MRREAPLVTSLGRARLAMAPMAAAALLVGLAACSKSSPLEDDGPRAAATTSGIPAAAASARVETASPDGGAETPATSIGTIPVPWPPSPPGSLVRPPPPRIHDDGATLSSAGLPVEVVRRIVRQNFGRFRLCYENALRMDPSLAGTVRTRFVVETDGSVAKVTDAGSTLPDAAAVACMDRAFGALSFPSPEGKALTVTYSLSFSTAPPAGSGVAPGGSGAPTAVP
jgi:hypothetical protein